MGKARPPRIGPLRSRKDWRDFNQWIKALRSGNYPQGYGSLQNSVGYCCLGVACRVVIPAASLKTQFGSLYGGMPELDTQPEAPTWLLEINDDFAIRTDYENQFGYADNLSNADLVQLNDEYGFTFDEIADVLEAVYVLRVFNRRR